MAENEKGISIVEHLKELRRRLTISAIAAAAGFLVCYYYSERLYIILTAPLMPALPEGQKFLAFTGIVEPFFIYMKVGLAGGIVLASPVILYEVWAFVAPALYEEERRWFLPVVFSSFALFMAGVLFAYFVVFPFGFKYLMGYSNSGLRPFISMGDYFSLVTKLMIAFGAVFQLPLAMLVLARLGIVSARQFLSWWRYAVVVIFVAAAVLTPTPDIFNQLLMAGPLILLYALGIIAARFFGKGKEKGDAPAC